MQKSVGVDTTPARGL